MLEQQDESDDENCVDGACGSITDVISSLKETNQWFQKFDFNGVQIQFKLDTGADVNVLPLSVLLQINPKLKQRMRKSTTKCEAFGGYQLKTLGIVKLKFVNKEKFLITDVIIMPDQKGSAYSWTWSMWITRLNSKNKPSGPGEFNDDKLLDKYSQVFVGLGEFPRKYKIPVNDEFIPTIKPPRRVAYSLLDKLKDTLNKMTINKVIEKVDQPKSWCSKNRQVS